MFVAGERLKALHLDYLTSAGADVFVFFLEILRFIGVLSRSGCIITMLVESYRNVLLQLHCEPLRVTCVDCDVFAARERHARYAGRKAVRAMKGLRGDRYIASAGSPRRAGNGRRALEAARGDATLTIETLRRSQSCSSRV